MTLKVAVDNFGHPPYDHIFSEVLQIPFVNSVLSIGRDLLSSLKIASECGYGIFADTIGPEKLFEIKTVHRDLTFVSHRYRDFSPAFIVVYAAVVMNAEKGA